MAFFFNSNSNFTFLVVTLFLCIGCKKSDEVGVSSFFLENKINAFDYFPTSTSNVIVRHKYYSLSYKENAEQAEWVAYILSAADCLKSHRYKRPYFSSDPLVFSKSADYRNYKKSGYDKGHLCPAGDRNFSKVAFDETFYTSNISPQRHDFNSGIWNALEQKVRYWAVKYNSVYVVTGGILNADLQTIGTEKVAVPKEFYKVLYCVTGTKHRMIAFILPAENSQKPLYDYVVSVDVLEKKTGIDFFHNLEDNLETVLEKNRDYKDWSF